MSAVITHHAVRAAIVIDYNLIAEDPNGHSFPYTVKCGAREGKGSSDWGRVDCERCLRQRPKP